MPYDSDGAWYEYEDEDNPDSYLCSDTSCPECYPGQYEDEYPDDEPEAERTEEVPFEITSATGDVEWTFNTVSNTSVPVDFSALETEGEEVPETPEVTPEEQTGPIRPVPIPQIPRVYFASSGGRMVSNVDIGCTVQISFWDGSPAETRAAYTLLKEWLVENQFTIGSASNDVFQEGRLRARIPYYFILANVGTRRSKDPLEMFSQPDCAECGDELEFPTLKCPNCETATYCQTCQSFSGNVQNDSEYGTYCNNCARQCNECSERFHASQGDCPACHPRTRCYSCSEWQYEGRNEIHEHSFEDGETYHYCSRCYNGMCYTCGTVFAEEGILENEGHQCVACVSKSNNEEWDENSELDSEELAIPTIPGREVIRLVGVEIEGANGQDIDGNEGGNILARALYDAGLSGSYAMNGYHSGTRSKVYVERDSSVDWEMVIGPLNVADTRDVELLNGSVRVVRGFINDKTLKLDMRAGLHVHVGAERVPFHSAYNLHKLYMYMEDFLYRFGAAKWPYHRSVNRRGRDQAGKSPNTEGKLAFARTFSGQRYYGLSFDNYFARYFDHCECGARRYGMFDECTCDLGKCTFEFRLFNTTANTVKLHAYLAICQSLVAKAIELEEIKDASAFPALDFTKTKVSDMHHRTRAKMVGEWEKRIVFVNEQLPLTTEEKKSIHYCIMNCEMGKLVSNADILLETEEN